MRILVKILKKPITSTIIAIICGFIVGAIILAISGYNPATAIGSLFMGIFSKPKYIVNVIIKSTPLILTGLSVAFAFKTGLFNMGAEGQYIVASVAAAIVGMKLNLPAPIQIPVVILAGLAMAILWGAIVGFLKAKFGIHEVITGIMLNWIALYLSNYICKLDAFKKPNTTGTYPVNESSYTMVLPKWKFSEAGKEFLSNNKFLKDVLLKTDLNFGIVIAVVVAILIWFILYRTTKGFELRAVGFNRDAAEFAGIKVERNIIQSMVIAGALAGLAGVLTITGVSPHCITTLSVFENNGFNGLSVALIAGSSPIGCIFSGLLFGGLIYGGQSIQSTVGAPSEIINIMIGTIVFFVSLTKVIPMLADKLAKRGAKYAD